MRCRQDQQRYIRQTIRAQAFVKQYPNFVVSETRVSGFFQRNKWETHHDLKKVMSQIAMLQKEKSKRQQKPLSDASGISYKGTGNFLSLEAKTLLAHRCDTQEWVGICDVVFPTFGRGNLAFLENVDDKFPKLSNVSFSKKFLF